MDHQDPATSLSDAFTLADFFSDCVEAINLIHGVHEESHPEEILISQLGIEQARLLIWGDVVGITSPPASTGITQAIPQHPGALNPEPEKALYFTSRDVRLDDPRFRQRIVDSLKAIAEPMTQLTKTKMLYEYGLYVFKGSPKVREGHMVTPNPFRLLGFREKHELLKEVTQAFPGAKVHQLHGVDKKTAWSVQDVTKAHELVSMIRKKVDYLIQLMDAQHRVDKAFRNDIRAMGWHPSEDMQATIRDTLKLSLLVEASETLYPEYSDAAQEAMDNVTDQWKGSHGYDLQAHHNPTIHKTESHIMLAQPLPQSDSPQHSSNHSHQRNLSQSSPSTTPGKSKRGGLLGALRPKLNRLFSNGNKNERNSMLVPPSLDPARSRSESGPSSAGFAADAQRSKSLANDDLTHVLTHTATLESKISRHDQYKG